jgi:hypothetical protein
VGSAVAFVPQAPKPQLDLGKAVQRLLVAPAVILGINSSPMVVPPAHAGESSLFVWTTTTPKSIDSSSSTLFPNRHRRLRLLRYR